MKKESGKVAATRYVSALEYSRLTGIGVEQVKKLCRKRRIKALYDRKRLFQNRLRR